MRRIAPIPHLLRVILISLLGSTHLAWADTLIYYRKDDRVVLGGQTSSLPGVESLEGWGTAPENVGVIRLAQPPNVPVGKILIVNADATVGIIDDPQFVMRKRDRREAREALKTGTPLTDAQLEALFGP